MAWNDQTSPVPSGSGGHPDQAALPTRPGGHTNGNDHAPQPGQAKPAPQYIETPPRGPGAPAPRQAAQPPQLAPPRDDKDQTDAHDDIWIERAKRAIAESQNDPFRQVQLLQHLNKLYLKERYGREVQGDKG